MQPNKLLPDVLAAPFPLRQGASLVPRMVFVASLSLAAASQQTAADTAVSLPPEGELPVDFRCVPDPEQGPDICPIDFDTLDINAEKYLEFTALELVDCGYPPDVSNTTSGAGVLSDSLCFNEDDSSISSAESQILEVDVKEGEGFDSSLSMEGIYLFPLSSFTGEGEDCPPDGNFECCLPNDAGTVEVTFEDGSSTSIEYSSDTSESDFGFCEVFGEHAVFVDFGGIEQVASIRVIPDDVFDFGSEAFIPTSVYASGLEVPDASPDICTGSGENNNDCEIQIGRPDLDGGDLRAVIEDPELIGNVEVVGGPWRVRDDRPHCAPGALPGDPTTPLVFDAVTTFNVDGVDMLLPLVVSDNGPDPTQYFTIQDTSCGISRMSYTGMPVPRTTPGSMPFIDIVEIATDIVPLANTLGFESDGLEGTIYDCLDVSLGEDPTLAAQPLLELNVREDEIKILKGVPGTIDEVARDITVDCGSKRGSFKGYSFVAWNMLHAIQTDIRAEIDAEIDVLNDSVTRYASCVDPSFYYGQLATWPFYINLYYDYGVYFATTGANPVFAAFYFDAAVTMIELFKSNLEAPGLSNNFLRCYATSVDPPLSPRLDLIKDTLTPLPTDVPLNAWGDLISQLEHLSYAIRTYTDELAAP